MNLTSLFSVLSLAKPLAQDILSGPVRFNRDLVQTMRSYDLPLKESEESKTDLTMAKIGGTLLQGISIAFSSSMGMATFAVAAPAVMNAAPVLLTVASTLAGIAALSPLTTKGLVALHKYLNKGLTSSFNKLGLADENADKRVWPMVEGFPEFSKARLALKAS